MRQTETTKALMLVPTEVRSGFSSYRGASKAPFLSQLIAERYHLSTQRTKRRAPVADVLRTYDAGGNISIRRLPPGYRMDVDA